MANMDKMRHDKTKMPIIAWDFDGTITKGDTYPVIQPPRMWAKEITNFLHECGIVQIIWITRDGDGENNTDIDTMMEFLKENGIYYDAINTVIEHSPWCYESRKIYAHMYVDDKAYGWIESAGCLMYVLGDILTKFCGCGTDAVSQITGHIARGEDVSNYARAIKQYLTDNWS